MTDKKTLPAARRAYAADPSAEHARILIDLLEDRLARSVARNRNDARRDDNLHRLAGIGMAIEIGGHEFARISNEIDYCWGNLPAEARESKAGQDLLSAFHQLVDGFGGMRGMKASSQSERWHTGAEIETQLRRHFFRVSHLQIDEGFRTARIYGRTAIIMPIFVNLVANAAYWAKRDNPEGHVLLTVSGDECIVADTGPGIDEEDVPYIFDPLFTTGRFGGTGVGLYLVQKCISTVMGSVRLITDPSEKILPGANFALKFPGMEVQQDRRPE